MKKKTSRLPSRVQPTVLCQLVELIPAYLAAKVAREHSVDGGVNFIHVWRGPTDWQRQKRSVSPADSRGLFTRNVKVFLDCE
jgi:hypothetical protein